VRGWLRGARPITTGGELPIEGTSSPPVRSATSRLRCRPPASKVGKVHPRPQCPDHHVLGYSRFRKGRCRSVARRGAHHGSTGSTRATADRRDFAPPRRPDS
jgi:hypothetical protein